MVRDMCKTVNHKLNVASGRSEHASVSNAQKLSVKFNMVIRNSSCEVDCAFLYF